MIMVYIYIIMVYIIIYENIYIYTMMMVDISNG